MQDFLKRELAVDDYVICIRSGYREFLLAQIIAFTPKYVRIKWGEGKYSQQLQTSDQLVKVSGKDLTWFLLQQDKK
jgi:hypothetical protein